MTDLRLWVPAPLDAAVMAALRRLAASDDVVRVAAMPDVHLAEDVCVGVAVATTRLLYPSAVGGDIGCGIAARRLRLKREEVDRADVAARLLAGFERAVPILAWPAPMVVPDVPDVPDDVAAGPSSPALARLAARTVPRQLGTLGRGNHFVELQVDDDDDVWLTVHSGSRGMGQAIRDHALAQGRRVGGGLVVLDDDSDAGRAYLDDVRWARAFAAAGRALILERAAAVVGDVMGAEALPETTIDGDHNHVVRAVVDGVGCWVHRKGAVSAGRGEPAVIPGSMGTATFHVVGRGCVDALCSSSHGAGRMMSRSEARRRIRIVDLGRQTRGVWFDHRKAARLVDEAPAAYKDIEQVMRAQMALTRIERRLQPLLSFKGV